MRYFLKELVNRPILLPDAKRVPFEAVGDGNGVFVTEDPGIIAHLVGFINRGIGGVLEISRDQFEALKKKAEAAGHAVTSPPSMLLSDGVRAMPTLASLLGQTKQPPPAPSLAPSPSLPTGPTAAEPNGPAAAVPGTKPEPSITVQAVSQPKTGRPRRTKRDATP